MELALQTCAVPFTLGPMTQSGLAARRRRHPAGDRNVVLAVDNLHQILGQGDFEAVAVDIERTLNMNNQATNTEPPVAPPNSPASTQTFTFPDSETEDEPRPKPRTQRKRRRLQSFKKPRVAPKKQSGTEADDEESADDNRVAAAVVSALDSDAEANQELSMKLRILAESQTAKQSDTNWTQVGEELRNIADKFQSLNDPDNDSPVASADDPLSWINLMLPISIPQSLWSAIVSYAAWKIMKRFQ